jgi:hypothetical protein
MSSPAGCAARYFDQPSNTTLSLSTMSKYMWLRSRRRPIPSKNYVPPTGFIRAKRVV